MFQNVSVEENEKEDRIEKESEREDDTLCNGTCEEKCKRSPICFQKLVERKIKILYL